MKDINFSLSSIWGVFDCRNRNLEHVQILSIVIMRIILYEFIHKRNIPFLETGSKWWGHIPLIWTVYHRKIFTSIFLLLNLVIAPVSCVPNQDPVPFLQIVELSSWPRLRSGIALVSLWALGHYPCDIFLGLIWLPFWFNVTRWQCTSVPILNSLAIWTRD